MPFLIPALVGLMVLPASFTAPIPNGSVATSSMAVSTVPVSFALVTPGTKEAETPFTVKLTGYNAVPAQTDGNPFVTASGSFSNPEVVAARSGDLAKNLPFGTIIAIERTGADTPACNYSKVAHLIGYRVIADAMNPRITNTVDVLLNQNDTVSVGGKEVNPGIALGICGKVTVRVVGHIAVKDIPKTQNELAAYIDPPVLAER
jgi:3D (Asp-Asp-Asp) domain-containing protein